LIPLTEPDKNLVDSS